MELKDHLRTDIFRDRIMSADEAALLLQDGMTVAVGGFTPSGTPKAVPLALARQVREGERKLKLSLLTAASTGEELDSAWAEAGIISRRAPYMTSRPLRESVNRGEVAYFDQHVGMVAQMARYGYYGDIDVAIIEAAVITAEGHIVPTTAVGCAQTYALLAKKVIIELNLAQSPALEGFHDIYLPADPPERQPIPLTAPSQRIGVPYIVCPQEKIAAVVVTELPDRPRPFARADETSQKIADNILSFLRYEEERGGFAVGSLPMQSGVGSVANAVLVGLKEGGLKHLNFYTEVMQDGMLDLLDCGSADAVSTTSLSLSAEGLARLFADLEKYRGRIILRDSEISNNAEIIRRLGVIAMNTAVEADIYGNVNSTHMGGTKVYNGIGGSGDYARNAAITIFMTASTAKGGAASSIVPMVSHVDHTEHDVDVLVTEQGWADLRCLSPKERAELIIERCAHPDFRPRLRAYFEEACTECGNAQTPHILSKCFAMHEDLRLKGTMREE